MSTISAGTTSTTALVSTGDTTGNLVLATGSVPTTALTLNSTTQAATFAGAVTIPSLNATNTFGFKNRIINGGMSIDQRNAGASVIPVSAQYTVDRWGAAVTAASKFSVQQNAGSVTPPAGFINYLGVTSLSAYSIAAGDIFAVYQAIEGLNIADLAWGTASAKTVTLSFWVRSSLTGTFGGSLRNSASNRSYPFSYTISVANTWEQKSVTIAGDTSGTWLTTNGVGIYVTLSLGSGSTYSASAGSWVAGNFTSATGAVSVVGTNAATFYITGVQLEVGSQATSFDFRSVTQELQLCQRYYWKTITTSSNNFICWVRSVNTVDAYGYIYNPVTMRDGASAVTFSGTGWWAGGAVTANSSVSISETGTTSSTLRFISTGMTNATIYAILPNGTGNYVALTAEL